MSAVSDPSDGKGCRVIIVDPVDLIAQGVAGVLTGVGYEVEIRAVLGDASTVDADIGVVCTRDADSLAVLRKLSALGVPVLAVVFQTSPDALAEALHAGASSVVAWDAPTARVVAAVDGLLAGEAHMPVAVATWLADRTNPTAFLSDTEIAWLAKLDSGMTIAEMAPLVGYSERSLYRLLHGLYGRLGVDNRRDAIAVARQRGLL